MGGEFPIWSMAAMAAEGRDPLLDWISHSVLFCFAFLFFGLSPFLKFPEIRNSDCAEILTRFFSGYKLPCAWRRAPTNLRCAHEAPSSARGARAHVACGGCGPPFALITPPKNHIYSKIILRKILLHLDFVFDGFSVKQKTSRKQELAPGTGSIC